MSATRHFGMHWLLSIRSRSKSSVSCTRLVVCGAAHSRLVAPSTTTRTYGSAPAPCATCKWSTKTRSPKLLARNPLTQQVQGLLYPLGCSSCCPQQVGRSIKDNQDIRLCTLTVCHLQVVYDATWSPTLLARSPLTWLLRGRSAPSAKMAHRLTTASYFWHASSGKCNSLVLRRNCAGDMW